MGIQFKSVSHEYFSFSSNDEAIKDINLTIEKEGEFVAILGHTGQVSQHLFNIWMR